ncbi:MAG: hypothetical protein Q8M29_11530 [Bacteroidota bacterium]|nr:hypothetical protein [Bacteroidota bacterium]
MKKLVLLLLFLPIISFSQELGENAKNIKDNYNSLYESTIKKYALKKWDDDFHMVVYEINKQTDALFNVVDNFQTKYSSILYKSLIKWSFDERAEYNKKVWDAIKTIDVPALLKCEADWSMVKYEYDKQVKALNSF